MTSNTFVLCFKRLYWKQVSTDFKIEILGFDLMAATLTFWRIKTGFEICLQYAHIKYLVWLKSVQSLAVEHWTGDRPAFQEPLNSFRLDITVKISTYVFWPIRYFLYNVYMWETEIRELSDTI